MENVAGKRQSGMREGEMFRGVTGVKPVRGFRSAGDSARQGGVRDTRADSRSGGSPMCMRSEETEEPPVVRQRGPDSGREDGEVRTSDNVSIAGPRGRRSVSVVPSYEAILRSAKPRAAASGCAGRCTGGQTASGRSSSGDVERLQTTFPSCVSVAWRAPRDR